MFNLIPKIKLPLQLTLEDFIYSIQCSPIRTQIPHSLKIRDSVELCTTCEALLTNILLISLYFPNENIFYIK